jgi:hypothetical protein
VRKGSVPHISQKFPLPPYLTSLLQTPSRAHLTYHDNSRRTKPTLTSIALRNPLLRRMRPLHIPYPLNCDDMFAIYADQRRKTCIDTSMVYLFCRRVPLRYNLESNQRHIPRPLYYHFKLIEHTEGKISTYNSTSATSSLGTPQLRPRQSNTPKILQQRNLRIRIIEHNLCAIEVEPQGVIIG